MLCFQEDKVQDVVPVKLENLKHKIMKVFKQSVKLNSEKVVFKEDMIPYALFPIEV
jgi:septum formation topological specificity factor MinE